LFGGMMVHRRDIPYLIAAIRSGDAQVLQGFRTFFKVKPDLVVKSGATVMAMIAPSRGNGPKYAAPCPSSLAIYGRGRQWRISSPA
jgi:hypothetical protein